MKDRVGVWVAKKHRTVTIARVLDGSPAEHAGVVRGDRLVAIDSVRTDREPFFPIIDRLNGAAETRGSLTLVSSGDDAERDVTFERRDFSTRTS